MKLCRIVAFLLPVLGITLKLLLELYVIFNFINPNDPLPKINATEHEFPWLVYLQIATQNQSNGCGGTIISPNWILTAAHCLYPATSIFKIIVVAGVHNLSAIDYNRVQFRRDKTFVIHEDFSSTLWGGYGDNEFGIKNDIALIELDEDFVLNEFVNLIPIGSTGTYPFEKFAHCETAGWGQLRPWDLQGTETVMKTKPDILAIMDKQILSNDVTGKGDSGGPLMCRNRVSVFNSRFYLVGIISASTRSKSMFIRVSNYSHWIEDHLWSNKQRSWSLSYYQSTYSRIRNGVVYMLGLVVMYLDFGTYRE